MTMHLILLDPAYMAVAKLWRNGQELDSHGVMLVVVYFMHSNTTSYNIM